MSLEQTAYIHSVETFGTVDGPGMRYVLFLAGCRLGCRFCHNRDTWESGDKTVSVSDVLAEYEKYRVFYENAGGGLTVSGGEPLLQPAFVAALFQACREQGIHTALDTAGWYEPAALELVLPYTDLVLFSVKAATSVVHQRLTGHDNAAIVANLRRVAAVVPLIVRHVIIPGITARPDELKQFASMVNQLPGRPSVELLAYHRLGVKKWEQLGQSDPLPDVPAALPADIEDAAQLLAAEGISLSHSAPYCFSLAAAF